MKAVTDRLPFLGGSIPDYASPNSGIWVSKITKTAGSPTVSIVSGGLAQLTLDNANEIQNLCLYLKDILPFPLARLLRVRFWAKLSGNLATGVSCCIGVGSARNDVMDSVVDHAWFRIEGNTSNALLCESDDGATDTDDKATGQKLSTTVKELSIDFVGGLVTKGPPAKSAGGLANLLFSVEDDRGNLQPVCRGTQFDISAALANNVQLIAQLQKTAVTDVATLSIGGFEVDWRPYD